MRRRDTPLAPSRHRDALARPPSLRHPSTLAKCTQWRTRASLWEYALQTPLRFGTLTLPVRLFVMNTLQCVRARAQTTQRSCSTLHRFHPLALSTLRDSCAACGNTQSCSCGTSLSFFSHFFLLLFYLNPMFEASFMPITPHHTTPHHTMPCHYTAQHRTTQHHTTQHHTAQHNTTPHQTTQHNTTPHITTAHNTVPLYRSDAHIQYDSLQVCVVLWMSAARRHDEDQSRHHRFR
jgi:hypothetical protein